MSATPPSSPALIEPWEVLDLLTSLVQKSLIVYEEDEQGQGRYRLLETVRQYARDRLRAGVGEAGREAESVRDRHLSFFVRWTEAAGGTAGGGEPAAWFEGLEQELDNLRAALEWSEASPDQARQGLRLLVATHELLFHEHCGEGREWLLRMLELSENGPGKLQADALMNIRDPARSSWPAIDAAAPAAPSAREEEETARQAVRAALGETVFAAAEAEGRAMSWEEAIDLALEAREIP